jgi:DNA polymerase delta subunit 1
MFENNLNEGVTQATNFINDLVSGKVPIKKLILSKNLRSDYANPKTIAHYQLVEKMKLRDPNSAPKPGDRVPFVYITNKNPKALSWERVEDPEYVVENKVSIDYFYYLEPIQKYVYYCYAFYYVLLSIILYYGLHLYNRKVQVLY